MLTRQLNHKLPTAQLSATPHCHFVPLWAYISSSWTTFDWLEDILLMHVHAWCNDTITPINII